MNTPKDINIIPEAIKRSCRALTASNGSVLVYLIVVILIFGILGATMVSLFTTATTSSATPNDARRAYYLAESGTRYAFSELRDNEFEEDTIIALNYTTYNVADVGSFTVNVFSPWFESQWPSEQNNSPYTLKVPEGKQPEGFDVPVPPNPTDPKVWAINFEYPEYLADEPGASSPITAYTRVDDTTLRFNVSDDFNVYTNERVCLGVKPSHTQNAPPLEEGDDLYVESVAKDFFPRFNGAIDINRVTYSYDRLVDEPANNRVKLENLTASRFQNTKTDFPLTVRKETDTPYTGDFIVLSPRNHMVISTGISGSVSYGGDYDFGMNIYNTALEIPPPPDIDADEFTSNITEKETSSSFISADTDADTLDIGGGVASEFGAGWYDADKSIGGDSDFCRAGACEFRRGIRAFFILEFNFQKQGDGLTFALIGAGDDLNNPINTVNSVGGDSELSELLGYAGDSRLNAAGTSFLDGVGQGLEPPKMAVEFDTRTNNDTLAYCSGASTADTDTRNDPFANNKDAVQFVFWGGKKLRIPCRDNSPTYDDNRHGCPAFPTWNFTTGGDVKSSPAIGADCTIYFGSNDNKVYALNPDGTAKQAPWPFVTGDDVVSSPAVAADGTIYVGSNDGRLYAINPDGSEKWRFPSAGSLGAVRSSPAIGADGTIYVGSDDFNVYAINPNGSAKAAPWPFVTGEAVRSSPAIGDDGTIYVGSDDFNVYAINPDGSAKAAPWPFVTGGAISMGRPAIGPNGTIHVAANDATLYAINPDGTPKPAPWPFNLTDNNDYAPGIDPNDGTVYSDIYGASLVAINPNGTEKWRTNVASDIDSTPAVGPDGTIYFGTDGAQSIFALELDNGNVIWQFPTGGEVDTSPAVSILGSVVFAGSNDNKLYAVLNEDPAFNGVQTLGPVSRTPQIRDLSLTASDLDSDVTVDDANNWLNGDSLKRRWAIRFEVDRSLVVNAESKFEYGLRLWIRQCQNVDCSDIIGTFFEKTRLKYDFNPVGTPPLTQQIELIQADHDDFVRFLFGFTGAAGSDELDTTISRFQLSLIRPGDPIVTNDPDWSPP